MNPELILIHILKLACSFIDMNYEYGCGLTSVLFTMITFYYSLKNNKNQKIDVLLIFTISGKFVSITALISLYCFTPNKSFCQNLSGIINGYIIKFLSFIFLPRAHWVKDFEEKYKYKFGFEYIKKIYRNINTKNALMRNTLNE